MHVRDCTQLLIGESPKNATWFHIDGQDEGRIERVSFGTASELMKLAQHIFEFCVCCHRIIAFFFLFRVAHLMTQKLLNLTKKPAKHWKVFGDGWFYLISRKNGAALPMLAQPAV
jgi:hypothetical protein